MIRATGIRHAFGDDVILDNVDLHCRRGQRLGIIGPGGVGKSVLLKIACGLLKPLAGSVTVEGQDIATLDNVALAGLRQRFGMLFQNYALFDFMTVMENVAFPLRQQGGVTEEEIRDRVESRLSQVELPGTGHLFPRELSGGMKKRVALARATIASAPILLYDDPTAGLDPVTSSKIFRLIADLHDPEGATVIVGHDVDRMMDVCDEWVMLYEAGVHFSGDTAAARASSDTVVQTFFADWQAT